MRIGVCWQSEVPFSFRNYAHNIMDVLSSMGIEFVRFYKGSAVPKDVDLYWDPFSGPAWCLKGVKKPLIVTLLGDYGFGLPAKEFYGKPLPLSLIKRIETRLKVMRKWTVFRRRVSAIITVSRYSGQILQKALRINPAKIHIILHGVDLTVFHPDGERFSADFPYFLHVSQYTPWFHHKKNVDRIIQAYVSISAAGYQLVMVIPGFPRKVDVPGIKIIREAMTANDLAKLYRGAVAFLFPSLHESFGMPILEAMACGCPVVTSNVTACPEVAGDAALLVNPQSVEEIAQAMQRLIEDEKLRAELREKGLARVKEFTWEKSAEKHLRVFRQVLEGCRK